MIMKRSIQVISSKIKQNYKYSSNITSNIDIDINTNNDKKTSNPRNIIYRNKSLDKSKHRPFTNPSSRLKIVVKTKDNEEEVLQKDRPFTLPSGEFKPKQSLGQNFLSDQNYVLKICDALTDDSKDGNLVVEIGPGPGALSRKLFERYPSMRALEIDQRAVAFLNLKLPGFDVIHMDVLDADWSKLAAERNGTLSVIANLPYYIVSQVLFSLADSHKAIKKAIVTMQLEVALRIIAKPSTKEYGIPSVVFQLYSTPLMNFKIPPTVFYPIPKVESALVTLDFTKPHPLLHTVDGNQLRRVVTSAFGKRRKMMRQSLKSILDEENVELDDKWGSLRPESLKPVQFIELTALIFGKKQQVDIDIDNRSKENDINEGTRSYNNCSKDIYASEKIWRVNITTPKDINNRKSRVENNYFNL